MTILFFLLFAVLLIVLPPVRLSAHGHCGEGREPALEIRLRPWIGLAGIRLFHADGGWRVGVLLGWWTVWATALTRGEDRKEQRGARKSVKKKTDLPDGFRTAVERLERAGLYFKRLWLPLRRSASQFYNGFRLRRISCKVAFGASDPATTGQIFGYFVAASSLIGTGGRVEATPDFKRQRLDGEAKVEIWIYPHRLLCASVYIAWRVGLAWFSERRNRKRLREGVFRAGTTS
jgi:hypothetical protein